MERFRMNQLFPTKPPLKKARGRPRVVTTEPAKKRKQKIPAAVQEAIWITKMGRVFEGKCLTTWCPNTITVFDFHAGHDIPESKGGTIDPSNLYPICARCNLSMGDRYTFKEWCAMSPLQTPLPQVPVVPPPKSWWCC
jgi:5-methylcytosine-specific restriction endonuclease McrA